MQLTDRQQETEAILHAGLKGAHKARRRAGLGEPAVVLAVAAYEALIHQAVTVRDVAETLGINESTARRHLNSATSDGILLATMDGFGARRYRMLVRTEREQRAVDGDR